MKHLLLIILLFVLPQQLMAQQKELVRGKIVDASDDKPMENVNIVNLNQVFGTATNQEGAFEIQAKVNDTLHLSFLGYKSIKVRVTNDWVNFGNQTTIKLTELAFALEEVTINKLKLTGYLEIDIKQIPIQKNIRYSISGLNSGYESSPRTPSMVTKVLGAIFNPADFLHNVFGKKPREMRKLRKMKQQDEIRNILSSRFDREMLTALLKVDKIDLDLLISECNYSDDFIKTANDLQILDAISECYEQYKILSRERN
ncbi:MAG: carboxypeptidase-like regulatory domain-containing protein [Flavobacteriaceae bacterium]